MSMERVFAQFAREHLGEAEARPPALIEVDPREQAAFYGRHLPFEIGDLVTPRKGTKMKDAGDAHIVIATREEAEHDLTLSSVGSINHGNRFDMRVLCWTPGGYAPFWVESADFEAWVDPRAKPASEPASAA